MCQSVVIDLDWSCSVVIHPAVSGGSSVLLNLVWQKPAASHSKCRHTLELTDHREASYLHDPDPA